MPELLIKIGDNFPHKDLMLSLRSTDAGAKQTWIEREAKKIIVFGDPVKALAKATLTLDDKITEAAKRWIQLNIGSARQGDIVGIRPDGSPMGARESAPRLYRVRIALKELEKLGLKSIQELRQPCWQTPPWEDPDEVGVYYHKFGWRLTPEAFSRLRADSVVEIYASDLVKKTRYEAYDPAKAVEHTSPGTYTIKPSGGDYTDLSTWEAAEQCDLTGLGLCVAECYKGDYSATGGGINYIKDLVSISGWTTTENDYVKVYTPTSERHNGKLKDENGDYTGFAIYASTSPTWISVFNGSSYYTQINGLIVDAHDVSHDSGIVNFDGGKIDSNIVVNCQYDGIAPINTSNTATTTLVSNNLVYNCDTLNTTGRAGIRTSNKWTKPYVYNNTVVNSFQGFLHQYDGSGRTNVPFYNNIGYGNTGGDFVCPGGAAGMDTSYSASSDATAANFNGTGQVTNISDPFTDSASDDYSLASDSTDVSNNGIGPDSDTNVPTIDIVGTARSGTTCDIGAFEYAGAGGTDALTASDITTGDPVLGTPGLGQTHVLTAADITTASPALGTPTIGQVHALTATSITTGAPSLGTPTIGQDHVLAGADIAAGAPLLGTPTPGQEHVLGATGIDTGVPLLGTPTLGEATDNLTATDIVTGSPVPASPTLGQTHALGAGDITCPAPLLGTPTASEGAVNLTALDISAGHPVLDSPALGQIHALTGVDIATGLPLLSDPTLGQVHVLAALGVLSGNPLVGHPALHVGGIVTPGRRTWVISAEDRTLAIGAEDRICTISAEERTYTI